MNFHFDLEGADDVARHTSQASRRVAPIMKRLLRSVGRRGVTLLRNFAPHRSGKLAKSIHYSVTGPSNKLRVNFFDRVSYGGFVITGTKPHMIKAKGDGVLRFTVGGQTVFARSVQHPGTRANPYPDRAARPFRRDAREIINTGMREIARIVTRG